MHAGPRATPTVAQLVGQHLLVRMEGSTPSKSFLRRIRAGQVGGVVLFQNNATAAQVPALVAKLQAAARAGGQLPLVIAVDQEGGVVKRLPGPPTRAPSAMSTAAVCARTGDRNRPLPARARDQRRSRTRARRAGEQRGLTASRVARQRVTLADVPSPGLVDLASCDGALGRADGTERWRQRNGPARRVTSTGDRAGAARP